MNGRQRIIQMFLMLLFVALCKNAFAELLSAAIVTGVGSAIGAGIQAWANWKGLKMQEAENRRAEALSLKLRDEDIEREESRYAKEWGAAQDQRKLDNIINLTSKMWQQLSSKPQLANNLVSVWRGRRAA